MASQDRRVNLAEFSAPQKSLARATSLNTGAISDQVSRKLVVWSVLLTLKYQGRSIRVDSMVAMVEIVDDSGHWMEQELSFDWI